MRTAEHARGETKPARTRADPWKFAKANKTSKGTEKIDLHRCRVVLLFFCQKKKAGGSDKPRRRRDGDGLEEKKEFRNQSDLQVIYPSGCTARAPFDTAQGTRRTRREARVPSCFHCLSFVRTALTAADPVTLPAWVGWWQQWMDMMHRSFEKTAVSWARGSSECWPWVLNFPCEQEQGEARHINTSRSC